jgi:hypothetical protein
VGFAYSPKKFNNKIVINGGAGIYYDRGELFTYLSQPAGGSFGGPFGVTESAPLTSPVTGNGTTLANPIGTALKPIAQGGSYIAPSSDPSVITNQLKAVLGTGPSTNPGGSTYGYSGSANPEDGQNCSGIDNQENYLDCPDALNFGAYDRSNKLPYTINFALNVQWQPRNDLAISLGYNGNRGRHSVIPIPFNEPGIATPDHAINGETSTYGFEVLNQNNSIPNSYSGLDYLPIANEPWNSEDGGNADFRTPYIGYSPNAALFETVGVSAYDSLQAHVEKRLSHHIQAGVSYTWGHALDEQSDIGLFFTGDNPNRLRDSWASSDFDRTHTTTVNFQATLPNAAKAHSLLAYATNDWSLTGIGVFQSGEPYSLYEYYGAVGSAYFGDYPTLMNPVLPIKDPKAAKSSALTGNPGDMRGAGGEYIPTIDPSVIAINYITPGNKGVPVSTGTDPQDIYETDFAPTNQRNIFRQAFQKRLDLSFRKTFKVSDRISVQYAFNVFNVTNTTSLDVPQDQTEIRQSDACSSTSSCDNVNYGQVVTSNASSDQTSALNALDELPCAASTGAICNGKTTRIPIQANGANFGSVTGTIGGNRAITMGLHIVY